MNNRAIVESVGFFVPEKIVTNHDLSQQMDTSDEWIRGRTGIEQRHIAGTDIGTSDLGVEAAKIALERANMKATDVDVILAATLSPDYFFPGIGVQIQDKLGANHVAGIDIRGQCSGFSWTLSVADAYLRMGLYKNVLIVAAEIHSRMLEYSNRGRDMAVLFGDAAAAMVLKSEAVKQDVASDVLKDGHRGIVDHVLGSDGSGAGHLLVDRPGMGAGYEHFMDNEEFENKEWRPKMDGKFVFKNAVRRMHQAAEQVLEKHGLSVDDIDLLVPHQANLRINEAVRQKIGLPEEKVFNNIQNFGNTTAATIPLALSQAEEMGKLKKGDLVLTVAFGSGFTWGANLLRY